MASSKEDDVMIVVHLVVPGLPGSTDWSGKLYALELVSTAAFRRAVWRTTVVANGLLALGLMLRVATFLRS